MKQIRVRTPALKGTILFVAVVATSLFCPQEVFAEADWERSVSRIDDLFRRGDIKAAAEEFKRAETDVAARFGRDSLPYAAMLNVQGGLHCAQRAFAEAESAYRRAAELRRNLLSENDPSYAGVLNNLGYCRMTAGNFADAASDLQRANEILKSGRDALLRSQVENNLGELALSVGNMPDAEAHFRTALDLRRSAVDADDPLMAVSYNNLAYVLHADGNDKEAIPLYEQSLALLENSLGPNSRDVAHTLHNLAEACVESGNEERAEKLFERALEIRRTLKVPEEAVTLNSLAELFLSSGKPAEAAGRFSRALELTSAQFPDRPDVVRPLLENLALSELLSDQYGAAEVHYRKLLSIASPPPFRNLGLVLAKQRKFEEAEKFYGEQLRASETQFGPESIAVSSALLELANIESLRGALDRASTHLLRAKDILSRSDEDVAVEKIEVLAALGDVYHRRAANAEAARVFGEAEAIAQSVFGEASDELRSLKKRRESTLASPPANTR